MNSNHFISIDGSFGEGGGQILRTSMSLAAITGKPLHITRIRANREKGGLQPQHLMACLAVKEICQGTLEGAEVGAKEIRFVPGKIRGGTYTFDIKTAGSSILVAQTVLPVLLLADHPSEINIIGGTHLPKSPSYDYFKEIFLPALHHFGIQVLSNIERTGYYPSGGGSINLQIVPASLKGNSDWKTKNKPHAIIRVSKLPRHIAERELEVLESHGIQNIEIIEETAYSQANSLTAWVGFRGVCSLGVKGKLAEIVAEELYQELKKETEDVDQHLADQLLLYASLGAGDTSYTTSTITKHMVTNAFVVEQFLPRKIEFQNKKILIR